MIYIIGIVACVAGLVVIAYIYGHQHGYADGYADCFLFGEEEHARRPAVERAALERKRDEVRKVRKTRRSRA